MLKILERTYKQSMAYAMCEFPNSVIVMKIDEPDDDIGYIIAVSTSPETDDGLCLYVKNMQKDKPLFIGGNYGGDDPLLPLYVTVKNEGGV